MVEGGGESEGLAGVWRRQSHSWEAAVCSPELKLPVSLVTCQTAPAYMTLGFPSPAHPVLGHLLAFVRSWRVQLITVFSFDDLLNTLFEVSLQLFSYSSGNIAQGAARLWCTINIITKHN